MNEPITYDAIDSRLKIYLRKIGQDEGETPHSFKAGCAITMTVGDVTHDAADVLRHLGWATETTARYYARASGLLDGTSVAVNLSNVMTHGALIVEETYRQFGDPIQFPAAKWLLTNGWCLV